MSERLIVRKLSPKAPLAERVAKLITKQKPTERQVLDEVTVDRPKRFAIGNRRNSAGYNDGRIIANTVEAMRDSLGESASRYQVIRVLPNGIEHELRSWEGYVNAARGRELKKERREGKIFATHFVDVARSGQNKEYRERQKAGDADASISKRARGYSSLLLMLLRRGTLSHVVARELRPGRSVNDMQSSLYGAYSRLQDGILDPMNVFHGFGETLTDKIKGIQEGPYRVFVNLFLGAHPKLNEAVAGMVNLNKITSRDSEDTKAAVLAYTAAYEKLTTNERLLIGFPKDWWLLGKLRLTRGQTWALALPSPSQFEGATDYNMSLLDKTLAIRARHILESQESGSGIFYQKDVASAVVGALEKIPTDTKLIHAIESRMTELTKRANGVSGGSLSKVKDAVTWAAEFAGIKPKKKAGESLTPEEKARMTIDQTLSSMAATLKKPMSIIEYTRAMTQMGEAFLQLDNLTPIEDIKWKQAVVWGKYTEETYNAAKNRLSPSTQA